MHKSKEIYKSGEVKYQRKGILGKIKHKKIMDAIILTSPDNMKIVLRHLRKYNAKKRVFDVLTNENL